jgi:hypothetical protein
MAIVESTGSAGNGNSSDETIDYALVDNSVHSYWIEHIGWDGMWLKSVVVEYTTTGP